MTTWIAVLASLGVVAPNGSVSVQGVLRSEGGTGVDGTYTVAFALYDAPEDGQMVWPSGGLPDAKKVTTSDGVFDVALEGVSPAVLAGAEDVWLSLLVVGEPELPRV